MLTEQWLQWQGNAFIIAMSLVIRAMETWHDGFHGAHNISAQMCISVSLYVTGTAQLDTVLLTSALILDTRRAKGFYVAQWNYRISSGNPFKQL